MSTTRQRLFRLMRPAFLPLLIAVIAIVGVGLRVLLVILTIQAAHHGQQTWVLCWGLLTVAVFAENNGGRSS